MLKCITKAISLIEKKFQEMVDKFSPETIVNDF